jgi:hypothetical protein
MQYPLCKLFVMFAVYALAFGLWTHSNGPWGIVPGFLVGTAGSALILLLKKKDVSTLVVVNVFAVGGGLLGMAYLPETIRNLAMDWQSNKFVDWLCCYDYPRYLECRLAGAVIGGIAGGFVGSLVASGMRWLRPKDSFFQGDENETAD